MNLTANRTATGGGDAAAAAAGGAIGTSAIATATTGMMSKAATNSSRTANSRRISMSRPLEPELKGAVADLDASPQFSSPQDFNPRDSGPPPLPYEAPFAPAVTAQPAEVAAHAPEPEASPPRRRSTVREPAPVSNSAAGSGPPPIPASSSPAPEPVITEVDEGDSANQPRRTGWWSRRSAGG